jgi:predicted nucleic acid-binding protein
LKRFWDSSGIVPLVVREQHTDSAEAWIGDASPIVVWWATPVECASAIARLVREGHLKPAGRAAAALRLKELAVRWTEVEPSSALREVARALVGMYPIRAADALQLAAARTYSGADASAVEFVTFDARLASAARDEGFNVLGA